MKVWGALGGLDSGNQSLVAVFYLLPSLFIFLIKYMCVNEIDGSFGSL